MRRGLIELGPALRPVLRREVCAETAHRALVGELLEALDGGHRLSATAQPIEPLSERELTVLRYLPTMMSNQEIASELFVSVNTLKTHLKQIYRKLDVTSRRDAVERARGDGAALAGPAQPRLSHSSAGGRRRTSTSSRPSDSMRFSSPCSAAWSTTGPCSTVSTRSTDCSRPSKSESSDGPTRPRIRISYWGVMVG